MESEVREGFVRQRRNLILGSFLLLFAQIAEIKVDKLIVFGNEIQLAHSYSITATLWVVTLYWFVRFYQYSKDLNSSEEISHAASVKLSSYMPDTALICLKETQPEMLAPPEDKPGATVTAEIRDYACLEARPNFHRGVFMLYKAWGHEGLTGVNAIGPIELIIDKKYLQSPRLKANFYVYVHTSKFTEYILPFVVFSLPVLYFLYLGISHLWI